MAISRYCGQCRRNVELHSADANACPHCGTTLAEWNHEQTVTLDWQQTSGDVVESNEPDLLVGREFDKYLIREFLGQGGMARVYLAHDHALERPCAIKILQRDKARNEAETLSTFLAEARAAAALVHPHVVRIHTLGTADGENFIEMEYIAGRSLSDLVKAAGGLEEYDATRFMVQISSALAAAHRMGMIHRDIKPANVMVSTAGEAKLADFGLAKRLTGKKAAQVVLSGTPSFMAPELFLGRRASKASDVYAMGVTYYSLLSGGLPIATNSLSELIRWHAAESPPDLSRLSNVSPSVVQLIERCLAWRPEERFADAAVLYDELRSLFGKLRSLDSLVLEALAHEPVELWDEDQRILVRVPLPDGRSQTVRIEIVTSEASGEEVVEIYSIAGPADPSEYERALELNATMSHGAIAIEEVDGERCFVVVNNYPRATCDPEEVRSSVLTIAETADAIEQRLGTEDRY